MVTGYSGLGGHYHAHSTLGLVPLADELQLCVRALRLFFIKNTFLSVPDNGTMGNMKKKHRKTLALIFARPISGNIKWHDIESLFRCLGANITEREGSRIGVKLFGEIQVFHRPHPASDTDKGAVSSIRNWFERNGVKP